jgi:hypothetical protein
MKTDPDRRLTGRIWTPPSRQKQAKSNIGSIKSRPRLAQAITVAGNLDPLLHELRTARAKRDELTGTIAALERMDRQCDRAAGARQVKEHLDKWRALLTTKHVKDGRHLLREVLAGPLRFTPEGRSYRFEGEATFGGIFAGKADVAPFLVALRGFEPRSRG